MRKLTDVDALFLGTDELDRAFIGETLIWNGDTVPELQTDDVYYDATSFVASTELGNQGVAGTGFDLPATGDGLALAKLFPGFVPEDFAYVYKGDIDPSIIGTEPRSAERLIQSYPYLYTDGIGTQLTIVNTGTEGTGANLTAESSGAENAARNMYFPGVSSNYMSVPDAAALDITTSIEITFRIALVEPDNRLGNQRIVAKSGASRGYEVFIGYDTAHATLNFTRDGSTVAVATEKLPFLPEHFYWVRVTYDSGTNQTNFYWAANATSEPVSWTQLGSTVSTVTGAIVANAETLKIGTYNGTSDMLKARLANMIIRNAASGGSVVLNIDIAADTGGMTQDVTTTFTATSGQTVTLTKSGTPPNTVRIIPALTWSMSDGNRYGYASNFTEIVNEPGELHVIWVQANVLAQPNVARRPIYPVLRSHIGTSAPYQNNSWGLYLDTFQAAMHWTMQIGGTDNGTELMSSANGVPTGTGNSIFGVALIERGSTTYAYAFRYNIDTSTYVFATGAGGSVPVTQSISATDLINSTTNSVQVWQGASLFDIQAVGYAKVPNFALPSENIQWNSDSADVNLFPVVDSLVRVVALGATPSYTVGEYWRASDDGTAEMASSGVEEGDIFAVKSVSPTTWQHIKFNHPSRRKTLYRPPYVTFGYPTSPLEVLDTEEFFIWAVVAANITDSMDEYIVYGSGASGAWMDIDVWDSGGEENIYFEIDDDDGNFASVFLDQGAGTYPDIWTNGHSDPTLFAMGIERPTGLFKIWMYDATNGYQQYDAQSGSDALTGAITVEDLAFFGPDLGEGYNGAVYWGGGWRIGTGILPTQTQVEKLWSQAVYGY